MTKPVITPQYEEPRNWCGFAVLNEHAPTQLVAPVRPTKVFRVLRTEALVRLSLVTNTRGHL